MNSIQNTGEITNFEKSNPKLEMAMAMKTLYEMSIDKIVHDILTNKITIKQLQGLPESLEQEVMIRVEKVDRYRWQEKIMESLVTIAFQKSEHCEGIWEKFYDEYGCRDFHQVFYIEHKEHDDEEDFVEVNQFDNEFYSIYQKVFYKLYPDPDLEFEEPEY